MKKTASDQKKKYLWRHPEGRVYVRRKGVYTLVDAPEGTPDFDRKYWEILTGKTVVAKTSFNALIKDYRHSDRWKDLKPRTRQDYDGVLEYISEKVGQRNVKSFTRADAIAAQKANDHRTRFANYVVQVFVVLCEHAIDVGWLKHNPAKGIRTLKTPEDRKQPHIPWTDRAVEKFRAEAHPLAHLVFELGVGSVQRPADLTVFSWGDYDGDSLRLTQGKTDKALVLPCTDHLREALDSHRAALGFIPLGSRRILALRDGSPMSYRYMADIMLKERKRLGLELFDLHALRYRGIMELAWLGCSDEEIAAYSGHVSMTMIIKYAGEARQIMRARQAREKRR